MVVNVRFYGRSSSFKRSERTPPKEGYTIASRCKAVVNRTRHIGWPLLIWGVLRIEGVQASRRHSSIIPQNNRVAWDWWTAASAKVPIAILRLDCDTKEAARCSLDYLHHRQSHRLLFRLDLFSPYCRYPSNCLTIYIHLVAETWNAYMEIAVPPCLLHKSGPSARVQQQPSLVRTSTALRQ